MIRGFVDTADFDSLRVKLDRANHMFLNLFKAQQEMVTTRDRPILALPLEEMEYVHPPHVRALLLLRRH